MNTSENICPVCKSINELEAVTCWHCGTALEDPFMDPGARTKTTDTSVSTSKNAKVWTIDGSAVPDEGIAVYVEGGFTPVHIDSKGEFVIGRKVEKTSKITEILLDLSPIGGYALGVSRRHAVIRRTENGYEILDLGSVNGTWLNDERLVPHLPYQLTSGSHLRLGTMRLFVLYHPPAKTK